MMFGEFIKEHRKIRRLTLRQFCTVLEFDPSQWSKIERGILAPPKNENVLKLIASVLYLKPRTPEYTELMDLAALGTGRIPSDILSDAELSQYLPLVFRTVRNSKPTEAELLALTEIIRENISLSHSSKRNIAPRRGVRSHLSPQKPRNRERDSF
jgi:transcriptional regulator with XRE-family HTH domain